MYPRTARESPYFFWELSSNFFWDTTNPAEEENRDSQCSKLRVAAKNHKRQRRKRQSVTAKREKSQTPKVLTAILTLPNFTKLNLTLLSLT